MAQLIEMPFSVMDSDGPKEAVCYMRLHIGATWRIRLNRPCAAAMRPFCQITLTTCNYYTASHYYVRR